MEKTKKQKRALWLSAGAALCGAVLAFGTVFGGFTSLTASAMTTANNKTNAINLLTSDSGSTFNGASLETLYSRILPSAGYDNTYEGVKSYLNSSAISKGDATKNGITSSQININNGGSDIIVNLGGKYWTVTYVSESKSGDLVATLWLTDSSQMGDYQYSRFSAGGWYNEWDQTSLDLQCNIYGSSYIRSRTLNAGTSYSYSTASGASATASTISMVNKGQNTAHPLARFTMVNSAFTGVSNSLTQYLERPLNMAWQEDENYAVDVDTASYTMGNEAYGTPKGTTKWWVGARKTNDSGADEYNASWRGKGYGTDRGSAGATNYASKTEPGGYVRFRDMQYAYTGKSQYNDWANDYVWLPSVSETGWGSGTVKSIWCTTANQRQNADGTTDSKTASVKDDYQTTATSTTVYNRTWLRSGYNYWTGSARALSPAGANGVGSTSAWLAVRPALHLNLNSAALSAAAAGTAKISIPEAENAVEDNTIEVQYNGALQSMNILNVDKDFVNATVTYQKEGETATSAVPANTTLSADLGRLTAVNAGTYTVTYSLKSGGKWTDGSSGTKTVTFKITSQKLAVVWTGGPYTYDGTSHTPTATVNYADGTAITGITYRYRKNDESGAPTGTATTTAPTDAGSYTVEAVLPGAVAAGYTIGQKTIKFTINKRTISVEANSITFASREYDGTTNTTANLNGLEFNNIVTADKGKMTLENSTAGAAGNPAFSTADAGVNQVSWGVALKDKSGEDVAKNYELETTVYTTNATITPKKVTVDGVEFDDKIYDGTAKANASLTNAEVHGLVTGEDLVIDVENAKFVSANVAKTAGAVSAQNVTFTPVLHDGTDGKASNYQIVASNAGLTTQTSYTTAKITPKQVDVVITAQTGIKYGEVPACSYTVTQVGAATGENVLIKLTYTLNGGTGTALDQPKNAGTYTINAAMADGFTQNYTVRNKTGDTEVTIAKADLTLTADSKSIAYGDSVPALAFTVEGLKYTDTQASILSGWVAKTDYVAGTSTAGEFGVKIYSSSTSTTAEVDSTTKLANYNLKIKNGKLTVSGAQMVVTIGSKKVTYDGTTVTAVPSDVTVTITKKDGNASTLTLTDLGYELCFESGVTVKNAGKYDITLNKTGTDSNYVVEIVKGTFEIEKAALTIAAKAKTIAYGDAPANDGVTYTGLVAADRNADSTPKDGVLDGSLVYSYNYAQYTAKGTYAITVSGVTAENYEITFTNGVLTVNARAVSVKVGGQSSVYGAAKSLDASNYVFWKDGAAIANVGDGALARAEDNLVLTLEASVTATTAAGKYDFTVKAGNTNYAVTFVDATGADLTADAEGKVTYTNGYEVKKASLVVTFRDDYIANGSTPDVANFDETRVDVKGLVNGEFKSILANKLAFTSAALSDGTGYEITVAFKTGESLANYDVEFETGKLTSATVIITVEIGDLTITYGDAAKTLADFTVKITDNEGKDSTLTLSQLGYELKFDIEDGVDTKNAGSYTVTAAPKSTGTAQGYSVRIKNGVYTVKKYASKVTVLDIASGFAYGDDPDEIFEELADLDLTDAGAVTTLAKYIKVDSLAAGEDLTVLGIPSIVVAGYQQYHKAGTYANALMFAGFEKDGAAYANPNYDLTLVNGSLTVAKRNVKIALDAGQSSEYKEALDVAVKVYAQATTIVAGTPEDGLVNGDELALKLKLGAADAGNTSTKVGTFALAVDGTYNANYNITNLNVLDTYAYKVTKREITVKANDIKAVYGATPAANGYEIVSGKLYEDEDLDESALAYEFYAANKTTVVDPATHKFATGGEYYLKAKGLDGEVYEIKYEFGKLTVTGAELTVEVTVDENAVYGKTYTAPDALVTATFTGVATGDVVTPVFTYYQGNTALTGTPVNAGDYSVVVTLGGTDGGKYTLEANRTTLHIAKKALTVTAPDAAIAYGDELPDTSAYTYKLTGLVNTLDADSNGKVKDGVLEGTAVYGFTYVQYGGAGDYAVTVSGLTAKNYDITFKTGKLTVSQRAVTINLKAQNGVYGETHNPDNTAYEFYKDGAPVANVGDGALARATDDLGIVITTDAVETSNVGVTYKLIVKYSNENYSVTFVGATENTDGDYEVADSYSVVKAELTVTVTDGTYAKGDAPEADDFTVSDLKVSGLKNSDDAATILGGDGVLTFAVSGNEAGTVYTVSVTVATLDNYNVTANDGTWKIVEAEITIKVQDATVTYNGAARTTSEVSAKVYGSDGTESSLTLADLGYELKFVDTEVKNAGRYTVTAAPVAAGATSGYNVVVSRGVITVEKMAVTIKAQAQTLTYGDAPSSVYADLATLDLDSDDALTELQKYFAVEGSLATGENLVTLGIPTLKVVGYAQYGDVDTYTGVLVISGLKNTNYEYTYVDGDLTVAKRTLKVGMTAADKATLSSEYGKPLSTVAFTVYDSDGTTEWTAGSALGAKIEIIGADSNALDTGAKHDAGKYSIKFNQDNLSGNYTLDASSVNTLVNTVNSGSKYEIKKAAITVKAADGSIGVGDAVDTSAGFGVKVVSGIAYEDAADIFATAGALTFSFGGYTQSSAAGTYDITVTVDNTKVTNYTVTVASGDDGKGVLTVSGANTVTIKLDETQLTSVYGDTVKTSAQIIDASSVVHGSATIADLELVFEIVAADGGDVKNAGAYTVNLKSYKSGLPYAVALDKVYTYTITKKPVTLVAKAQTLTYGDDPAQLFDGADFENDLANYVEIKSGSAFATGEGLSDLNADGIILYVSGYKQYGDVKAGGYANVIMLSGITSDNYDITFESGTLTVNKREIKIVVDTDSLTSVYGEEINITYKTYLKDTTVADGAPEDGLVDGDKLGLKVVLGDAITTLADGVVVGSYHLAKDDTAFNNNYAINATELNSELTKHTYSITAKEVTVTADSVTITYGEAAFTGSYGYKIEGLLDGETLTGTITFTVEGNTLQASDILEAGEHTVTPSGLSGDNYDVTYVDGKITVNAKEITVTVKRDGEKAYDGANVALPTDDKYFTVESGALVDGDDEDSLGLTLKVLNNGSDVDVYSVVYDTHTNDNYKLNVINGTYKITAKKVYVQWIGVDGSTTDFAWVYNVTATSAATAQGPSVKFYDDSDFDTANEITGLTATVIGQQINVGENYSASVQLNGTNNYVLASTDLTKEFKITAAELTVQWKKNANDAATVNDSVNIEYPYNASRVQSPVPVLYLDGVDVTAKVIYSLSGRTQEIGEHTVMLELGANYVIKLGDGSTASTASRAYKILGTQLSNFHWKYPNGTVIGDAFIGGTNVQKVAYNGNVQQLIVTTSTIGATVSYEITDASGNSVSECKDAGVYKIKAVVSDGYSIPAALEYANFEITKVKVNVIWDTATFTYDFVEGTSQHPVASFTGVDGETKQLAMTYYDAANLQVESCINAGTYNAVAKFDDEDAVNYDFIGASNASRTFTIRPAVISVQWGFLNDEGEQLDPQPEVEADGTYKLAFTNADQTFSWMAQMGGTQTEQDDLKFVYTLEKDGEKVYENSSMTAPEFSIKDAGVYKVTLSIGTTAGTTLNASNYTLASATQTIKVERAKLEIKVSQVDGTDGIDYGEEIAFTGDNANFKVEIIGLQGDDTVESLGLVDGDGEYWWLTTAYTTTANPGSIWTIDLIQNAAAISAFQTALKNYDVQLPELVGGKYSFHTFTVNTKEGAVVVIGENTNVNYFIYDGTSKMPQAGYVNAQGDFVELEVELLEVDSAVKVGTYSIKVTKPAGVNDGITLTDIEGNPTDTFTFEIKKIVLVIEVGTQSATYGDIHVEGDDYNGIVQWQYGVYAPYSMQCSPLAGDEIGLGISVVCNFTLDGGNFANCGTYEVICSWNDAEEAGYSDNYEVIFCDEHGHEIGADNKVYFTVDPAKIIVSSRGEEFFDEEIRFEPLGKKVGLANKKEDGTYENIVFQGWQDVSDATVKFENRIYDLNDSKDVSDLNGEGSVNYTETSLKINAVGKFAVKYKVTKANHEDYEGKWRIIVLKSTDAIIVLFQNEFEVHYGDGVPEDLTDKLFGTNAEGQEYFTLSPDGAVTDKEQFRTMVERAYVYNVDENTNIGYYTIYFDLKEGLGSATSEYGIIYREIGQINAQGTNHNIYKIMPRELSIDWGLASDTFEYDGEAHKPAPTIYGWRDGGVLELTTVINGQMYYYVDINGERITIAVATGGDFTAIGQDSYVKLTVNNLNYSFTGDNAEEEFRIKILSGSISPVEPTGMTGLPLWAYILIGAALLALLILLIVLAAALKKRKALAVAGDDDGFYDDAEDDDDGFNDIFSEE